MSLPCFANSRVLLGREMLSSKKSTQEVIQKSKALEGQAQHLIEIIIKMRAEGVQEDASFKLSNQQSKFSLRETTFSYKSTSGYSTQSQSHLDDEMYTTRDEKHDNHAYFFEQGSCQNKPESSQDGEILEQNNPVKSDLH